MTMADSYIYHYARYGSSYADEFLSLEEALQRSWQDHRSGEAYGMEITRGEMVIYDVEQLGRYWEDRDERDV